MNCTTGIIATVSGLILALIGVFAWLSYGQPIIGIGLLVLGLLDLAFGAFAYRTSVQAKGRF